MEAISGRARLTETLERMVGEATDAVLLMNRPPFLVPRPRWNVAEIGALRRGCRVRRSTRPRASADRRRTEPLVAAGGEVRVLEEVRMKLLVCGPDRALISLRDAATGEQSSLSTVVRHPDLVEPLRLLFEQHWSEATPLPTARSTMTRRTHPSTATARRTPTACGCCSASASCPTSSVPTARRRRRCCRASPLPSTTSAGASA